MWVKRSDKFVLFRFYFSIFFDKIIIFWNYSLFNYMLFFIFGCIWEILFSFGLKEMFSVLYLVWDVFFLY